MKSFTLAAILLLIAGTAQAQVTQGPVTTAMKFSWNAPVNTTLADQPTYEVRLRLSSAPTVVTPLLKPTCTGTAPIVCQVQLTQQNVDALNMVGVHNITLSYFRTDVGEGPQSSPFALRSPAGAPTAVGIIP